MIAIISFVEQLYLPEEEAKNLKLKYSEYKDLRLGIKSDNSIHKMWSGEHYKDDLILDEITNEWKTKEGKTVSSYNIYTHPSRTDYVEIQQSNQLVDLEWFLEHCPYKFYIEQYVKTNNASAIGIQNLLDIVGKKVDMLNQAVDAMSGNTFNQRCNVHVGGGLIVTYNELMLKEDCCTDELQCELNNGWRIIAVCVQPDQRRPDYVLGRFTPQLDVNNKHAADR